MAKTYEAIVKAKGVSGQTITPTLSVEERPSPDLLTEKQMINLNYIFDLKSRQDNLRVINFVSASSGEGTSTVIVNFIRFMLETKATSPVLLIDANFLHPALHLEFNVPVAPGLKDFLRDKSDLSDVIQKIGSSSICLIPNGNSMTFDRVDVEPQKYLALFSQLRNRFQFIFIDSPPLLESSGALAIAALADSTFLVIQAQSTRLEVVEKAKNYLNRNNCEIGGVILNRVLQPIPDWIYKRI